MGDMVLSFGNRRVPVASLAEASAIYSAARDRSGKGASGWPDGAVLEGDKVIGRVSYNGRVWEPGPWKPDSVPLYDNRREG